MILFLLLLCRTGSLEELQHSPDPPALSWMTARDRMWGQWRTENSGKEGTELAHGQQRGFKWGFVEEDHPHD